MGLPFETPGGYPDDNTAPDLGRYTEDFTTPDYDGYSHDVTGDDSVEDDLFEDDYDDEDGYMKGDGEAGGSWDPGTGPSQM
jgi:hypothetical protein